MENTNYQELSKARKRLIAALFAYLKNENPGIDYVKSVACKAAKVEHFNDISLSKLKHLYRVFGVKNTPHRNEVERELIWSLHREFCNN